jgi:hypothetical protein
MTEEEFKNLKPGDRLISRSLNPLTFHEKVWLTLCRVTWDSGEKQQTHLYFEHYQVLRSDGTHEPFQPIPELPSWAYEV